MVKKQSFKHPNSKKILSYILDNIVFEKHALVTKGKSTFNTKIDYNACNELFTPYTDQFCLMAGEGFNIIDFWVNIVEPGGHTKTHNHKTNIKELKNIVWKTGVFYLKKPRQSGNIIIENKLTKVRENDMIIFDPWLNHSTEKNKSNKQRIIFSVNLAKGIKKIYKDNKYFFIKV